MASKLTWQESGQQQLTLAHNRPVPQEVVYNVKPSLGNLQQSKIDALHILSYIIWESYINKVFMEN